MNRFVSRLVSFVLVAISTLALTDSASATVRSYSSRGTAHFVSATSFVGAGQATHLGLYDEAGTAEFSPTSTPGVLHVEASVVYTAANGDELHTAITGELDGPAQLISATVTFVGGTGRFANASGSAELDGLLLAGGAISVTVRGNINY